MHDRGGHLVSHRLHLRPLGVPVSSSVHLGASVHGNGLLSPFEHDGVAAPGVQPLLASTSTLCSTNPECLVRWHCDLWVGCALDRWRIHGKRSMEAHGTACRRGSAGITWLSARRRQDERVFINPLNFRALRFARCAVLISTKIMNKLHGSA